MLTRRAVMSGTVLSLLAGPAALAGEASADSLSPDVRAKTFDAVWRQISETFWDPGFAGRDWTAIGERYRASALAASDSGSFHRQLDAMVRELGLSHFAVLSPEAVASAKGQATSREGWAGLRVRMLKGQAVVVQVEDPAAAAGVQPGWIVESVSGRKVMPAETSARLQSQFSGQTGDPVQVAFRLPKDEHRDLTLVRGRAPGRFYPVKMMGVTVKALPAQYAELETRRIGSDVGYLRFSQFVPAIEPDIEAAIRGFGDAHGLVIDLRGNPGGEDVMGVALADLLVDRPGILMRSRQRGRWRDYNLRPDKAPFRGRVVLLVDADSASASEQFAAGLQELGRATVVGERTRGRDLDAKTMALPSGGILQYATGLPQTPKGVVIEGRGVIPDVPVELDAEALAAGRDTQLDAAVAVARS